MEQRVALDFYVTREEIFSRIERGRLDEALNMTRRVRAAYPSRGEVPFWLACLACRLRQPDEALDALEEGLRDGLWWADDWLSDDDLAPLRGDARFAGIRRRSAAARAAWSAAARREGAPGGARQPSGVRPTAGSLLLVPAGMPAGRPAGALVALHGWGQLAADTGAAWRGALEEGLRLLVPESSQVESPGFHVWSDAAAAGDDVAAAYRGLRTAHPVDERRLVAAGFSQGGGLAVAYALSGRVVPAAAFIAFGAGVGDVDAGALDAAPAAAARGVRGALFMGAGDEDLAEARELHERMADAGVACSLDVLPGLAHQLPADPAPALRAALRRVLRP